MKDFRNKVAVVTGAASGIGKALAEKCLNEGMHVVLADIEKDPLQDTVTEFKSRGFNSVMPVLTDVSIRSQIEDLASKALERFGGVHLLFNNAGISAGTSPKETTYDDWEWVLGVNLWSVIYGLKTFIPIMEAQDGDCHIVNTASLAGVAFGQGCTPYAVTKHGVVALSEAAFVDHRNRQSNVGISVLCPHFTATRILEAERNRPAKLPNATAIPTGPPYDKFMDELHRMVDKGLLPADLAEMVFQGIRTRNLYILTSDAVNDEVLHRARLITEGVIHMTPMGR
jgi:NAD(P)-dependent dehydrogenase (short-subunit alcohol dehydrogenase family)